MLVLSRYEDQAVVLVFGETRVRVIVSEIKHTEGAVRLGFEAPPNVRIWREEIMPQWDKERRDGA